jgi:hypothetical protein
MKFRNLALAACVLATTLLPNFAQAATANIIGGETKVALSSTFVSALGSLGVAPGAVGPASLFKGVATFPITVGVADLTNTLVDIGHVGGLSLTAGSTKVTLVNFQIEVLPGVAPYISGIVTVNGAIAGRLPLFDLTAIGNVYQPGKEWLSIQNVTVVLDPAAAAALNKVFGVTAFTGGFSIGTANTMALLETEYCK